MIKKCGSCRYNNDNFIVDCDDGCGDSHYECPNSAYVDDGYGGYECSNYDNQIDLADIASLIANSINVLINDAVEFDDFDEVSEIICPILPYEDSDFRPCTPLQRRFGFYYAHHGTRISVARS